MSSPDKDSSFSCRYYGTKPVAVKRATNARTRLRKAGVSTERGRASVKLVTRRIEPFDFNWGGEGGTWFAVCVKKDVASIATDNFAPLRGVKRKRRRR
jgi:hypothetical protein